MHVVDIASLTEREDLTVNLNQQIATEPAPPDPAAGSLAQLFGNDIVAIDADPDCENFFIVSRGGNYVLKAQLGPDGKLDIGAPNNVVRFQTGNIPTGIVVDEEGELAFVNNQVNMSVSVLDLEPIPSSPGTSRRARPRSRARSTIRGWWASWCSSRRSACRTTAWSALPVRDIVPLDFRGKQSDRRLELLRLVPRRGPGRRRHLDLRRRPAPDHSRWTACTPRSTARTIPGSTTGAPRATA